MVNFIYLEEITKEIKKKSTKNFELTKKIFE